MISRRLRSGFVLGAVFGLAACGSAESGNGQGTGGSTSTGGASASGGAGPTGGTTTLTGGATNTSGASNVGGMSAGGAGGTAGGTGKGFGCPADKPAAGAECSRVFGVCTWGEDSCLCSDDVWECYTKADCPATAPAAAAACDLGGMACSYGGLNCTCSTTNGWSCQTPCPQQEPAADATCTRPANSTCRYTAGAIVQGGGMAETTCACSEGKFTCFSEDDCPATAPSSGAVCDLLTISCPYTDSRCRCDSDGTWSCVTDCPDMTPADAAACERPEQQACRYSAGALVQGGMGMMTDATCTCRNMQFDCITQADCPAAAPADAAMCAGLSGLACTYPDRDCECDDESWECQSDCPAAPPAAASSCFRSANQTCRYAGGALIMGGGQGTTADNTCACIANAFVCYTAADCPAAAPASATACDKPALSCAFGTQNCRCSTSSGMWTCSTPGGGNGGAGGMSSTAGGGGMMSVAGGGAGGVAGASSGGVAGASSGGVAGANVGGNGP
jgi:hypothetical protein